MRASSTTGIDSQWPIVIATVCRPRWWLSSWARTPWQLGCRQLLERERGDDHEVAAARKRVQVRRTGGCARRSGRRGAGWCARSRSRAARSSPPRARSDVGHPSTGVRTRTWKRRTNSSGPIAAHTIGTQMNETPVARPNGSQMMNSASSVNGSIATTGTSAQSADPSTRRRCLSAVPAAINGKDRNRDAVACSRVAVTRPKMCGTAQDRWRRRRYAGEATSSPTNVQQSALMRSTMTAPDRDMPKQNRVQESMTTRAEQSP